MALLSARIISATPATATQWAAIRSIEYSGLKPPRFSGGDEDVEQRQREPQHRAAGQRERLRPDPAPEHEEHAEREQRRRTRREHEPERERDRDGDQRRAARRTGRALPIRRPLRPAPCITPPPAPPPPDRQHAPSRTRAATSRDHVARVHQPVRGERDRDRAAVGGHRPGGAEAAPTDGSPRSRPSQLARRPRLKLSARTSRAGRVEREPHPFTPAAGRRALRRPPRATGGAAAGGARERSRSRYGVSRSGAARGASRPRRQRHASSSPRRAAGGPRRGPRACRSSRSADAAPADLDASTSLQPASIARPAAPATRGTPARGPRRSRPRGAAARHPAPRARTRPAGSRAGSPRPQRLREPHDAIRVTSAAATPVTRCAGGPASAAARRARGRASARADRRRPRRDPLQLDALRPLPLRRSTAAACRRRRSRRGSPDGPGSAPTEEARRGARRADRAAASGASVAVVAQPSSSQVRAAGGENTRVEAALAVTAIAHQRRARRAAVAVSRRNGSSPVVRWNTYVRLVPRESATRERPLGQHRRPQRLGRARRSGSLSSRMPAVTSSPSGCCSRRSGPPASVTSRSPTGRRFQPACTG